MEINISSKDIKSIHFVRSLDLIQHISVDRWRPFPRVRTNRFPFMGKCFDNTRRSRPKKAILNSLGSMFGQYRARSLGALLHPLALLAWTIALLSEKRTGIFNTAVLRRKNLSISLAPHSLLLSLSCTCHPPPPPSSSSASLLPCWRKSSSSHSLNGRMIRPCLGFLPSRPVEHKLGLNKKLPS